MLGGVEILGDFAFNAGVFVATFLVAPLLVVLATGTDFDFTFVVGVLCGDGSGEVKATGRSEVLATGEAVVAGDINPPPLFDTGWKNKKAVSTLPAAAIKNTVRFIISWLLRYFLMLLREMISNRLLCR